MSSNRSTLKPTPNESDSNSQATPNYEGLVRFLVQPFLDSPDSLRLDCERFPHKHKAWIRMAIEGIDKGRVFGRGGRNLQAVRMILTALASAVGESVHLDVYGEESTVDSEAPADSTGSKGMPRKRNSNWSEKPTKAPVHRDEDAESSDKGDRGKNKPRKQRRRSPK